MQLKTCKETKAMGIQTYILNQKQLISSALTDDINSEDHMLSYISSQKKKKLK